MGKKMAGPPPRPEELLPEIAHDVRAMRDGQERHTAAIKGLGDAIYHLADTLKSELRLMASLRADSEFRGEVKERGASLKASAIANLSGAGAKPCPYLKSTPSAEKGVHRGRTETVRTSPTSLPTVFANPCGCRASDGV